jgi:regulator of RNase E activity RraA
MDRDGLRAGGFGHLAVVPPRVHEAAPRVAASLLQRLAQAYVPDISDAVGPLYTMDPAIRPLYSPMPRIVGQALTVKTPPGDNLTVHGALGMIAPGDVLVVDSRGYTGACATGATSLVVPIRSGLRGVVVDGAWRDAAELRALNFPVCGRGLAAFSPPKERLGEINVPVCCGGVVVHPGDIVVGDEEGVVVVPRDVASIVVDSLPLYRQRRTIDDYDIADLEDDAARRREYFEAALAAGARHGGPAGATPGS